MAYRFALLMVALLVSAPAVGANARTADDRHTRWVEAVTAAGLSVDEVVYPFHVTTEMAEFAQQATRWRPEPTEKLELLQLMLFNPHRFDFTYDREATRTAIDAFEAQEGNCLAFTAMFVALARSVGLDAELVSVERVVDVTEQAGFAVATRHVVAGFYYKGRMHFYDFAFERAAPTSQRWHAIDDVTVSSMFHANWGTAALRAGLDERAGKELALAVALAPERVTAWVNLGVARRRLGDPQGAIDAYQRALELDPEYGPAFNNLAAVFQSIGRWEEAEAALGFAANSAATPFALISLADVARTRGDLEGSRRLLGKARRKHGKVPAVYEGLHRWAEEAGKPEKAQHYERRAGRLRERGG